MRDLSEKLGIFARIGLALAGVVTFLILALGSASAPMNITTSYVLTTNPPGAKIYRGSNPNVLQYYKTTPFYLTTRSSEGWSNKYFQARKEGYYDSELYLQPTIALGTRTKITFAMKPKGGDDEFAVYKSRNTLSGYYEFLEKFPQSQIKNKAFKHIVELIGKDKDNLFLELSNKYPQSVEVFPEPHRLSYVGPKGMKVFVLKRLLKEGIGGAVIEQKILSADKPYKEFDFEEIRKLKKMGITDQVIAAMLKVTTNTRIAQKEQQSKEVKNRKMLQQATVLSPNAAPNAAAPKAPGIGDKLADCAILLAKKEACDQLSFFAAMACKALIPGGHNCF